MDEKTIELSINGVNRRVSQADLASPGRMLLGQQESNGRQTVTARRKFSKEDNLQIFKAYY